MVEMNETKLDKILRTYQNMTLTDRTIRNIEDDARREAWLNEREA